MTLRDPASGRTLLPLTGLLLAALLLPLLPVTAGERARPSARARDAVVVEGSTIAFRVRVRGPLHAPVTIRFSTRDGTAVAGEDYEARSGRLRFRAGTRVRTVRVRTLGDDRVEGTERFSLRLRRGRAVRLADRRGIGTILDDTAVTPPEPPAPASPLGRLVLTEVDYDQPGADDAEFVEMRNASAETVSLEGLVLDLVNGADDASYAAVDLSGPGTLAPGAALVAAAPGVAVAAGAAVVPLGSAIQNGPDGLMLLLGCAVVDALAYEGAVGPATVDGCPPLGLGGPPAAEDSATDPGALAVLEGAWAFTPTPTPGAPNA